MSSTDRATREHDEAAYREHNVTRLEQGDGPTYDGGLAPGGRRPNAPSEQCQCDACKAHRKRASMTGTADVDKSV